MKVEIPAEVSELIGVTDETRPQRRTSWTADELVGTDFPPMRWAVPGLIAEGLNLLAGPPKLGKSWLALNLGIAVAAGGSALGKVPVDQGDVLYLALEDTGRRLKSRLVAILGDEPAPPGLHLATECAPIPEGGAERIEAWLGDHLAARLVIVDVFTKVRGKVSDRANRYEADYHAMSQLKSIADRYGVAMLVLHHTRKASGEDFLDTVSGTHGIAGAADAVLVLTRSRGSAEATLQITGRDVEEAAHALNFAAEIGTWSLLEGPAADYEMQDTRRRIRVLVREQGPLTPTQIAEALELNLDNVKQTVRRMIGDDQIDTDGSGHYFAPLSPVTSVTQSPDLSDTGYMSDREER